MTRSFIFGATVFRMPYAEYGGTLPKTIHASRAGTETFLRRLVLGGDYKNIRQIIGTVTGVPRNPHNPEFIDHVTVRTPEGTQNIAASLVIGMILLYLDMITHTNTSSDCTGPASCWPEMAPTGGIRVR